jgi:hypothetical protein
MENRKLLKMTLYETKIIKRFISNDLITVRHFDSSNLKAGYTPEQREIMMRFNELFNLEEVLKL